MGGKKKAWLSSIRLDHEGEGAMSFLSGTRQRLGDLTANPYTWLRG